MRNSNYKNVSFSNKKKLLIFTYFSGKVIKVHYDSLGIKTNIEKAWVDKETNKKSIGIRFTNGRNDYIPYDQPLAIAKDPDYLLQNHIEIIIARIKDAIKKKNISKRYLVCQLKTTDNQIQRLLNPNILNKNLGQLYKLANLLNLEFEIIIKRAA